MTSAAAAPAARSIALDATWCYRNRQMCGVGEAGATRWDPAADGQAYVVIASNH